MALASFLIWKLLLHLFMIDLFWFIPIVVGYILRQAYNTFIFRSTSNGRNPRLFFASVYKSTSTSTSTTTLSTYSFCYTTVSKVTKNCRRKKSYIMEEEDNRIGYDISPSSRYVSSLYWYILELYSTICFHINTFKEWCIDFKTLICS